MAKASPSDVVQRHAEAEVHFYLNGSIIAMPCKPNKSASALFIRDLCNVYKMRAK